MQKITYGTVCSGIECVGVAVKPLGWEGVFLSEIEPFPSKLLDVHWPDIPNHGDMTKLAAQVRNLEVPLCDVLVGGTPCQAFSVAGQRQSLDDERGNLTLEFVRLADALDEKRAQYNLSPTIILWENVPGVFSVKDNAFGCFLAALVGADDPVPPVGPKGRWSRAGMVRGPKRAAAWRVLDAQYFGVPQRRERVFVVASAGDGFDPSEILFESEGVRRDSPPRRETGEKVARSVETGVGSGSSVGEAVVPSVYRLCTANTDVIEAAKKVDVTSTLSSRCEAVGNSGTCLVVFDSRQTPVNSEHICGPLDVLPTHAVAYALTGISNYTEGVGSLRAKGGDCGGSESLVAYGGGNTAGPINIATTCTTSQQRYDFDTDTFVVAYGGSAVSPVEVSTTLGACRHRSDLELETFLVAVTGDITHALNTANNGKGCSEDGTGRGVPLVTNGYSVRRLMPVETERLQGLPDDYTNIPWRNKNDAPDSLRYKAVGNGMAVPVIRWICERIGKYLTESR